MGGPGSGRKKGSIKYDRLGNPIGPKIKGPTPKMPGIKATGWKKTKAYLVNGRLTKKKPKDPLDFDPFAVGRQ